MNKFYTTLLVSAVAVAFSGIAIADGDCQGNCPSGPTESTTNNTSESNSGNNTFVVSGDQRDEFPASSAPNLILGTCQAGLTAQSQMGGGSMGGPDEVCLLFTLSQIQLAMGDREAAYRSLDLAETTLKWRANPVRRFFQAIPLLGRIF
jgi:hypothetical protein